MNQGISCVKANPTAPLDFYQSDEVSGKIKIFLHMQTLIEISFYIHLLVID